MFFEALEKSTEERGEFLTVVCEGDADLRQRVDALLTAHDRADSLLGDAPSWATVELEPGDRVGDYQLIERVGQGGFGVVFLAQQSRPVRRRVALKVIRLGMDTAGVIARFEAERQALALMDHPNIARVLDAGATDKGRPFFVMEFVDGVPITEYCEREALSLRDRLELFKTVCLALQHAHQKGVIHRDIKPSNVLVSKVDGKPMPKLIDFGIAKATEFQLTDVTQLTHEGHVLGTPAYMSPEHAQGNGAVDTRSDVYSLGALLYELLSGRPPFVLGSDGLEGFVELLQRVREVDPPRPSSARRDESQNGSANWTTSIRVLPELDWIAMKCLDKNPARRYASANALARDITRFLDHRPIEAAPPSLWYQIRKLVRRYRFATFVLVTVVVGLFVGVAGAMWGLAEAQSSAEIANRERANVLRLSAFQRLDDLRRAADQLWPVCPDSVDRYRAWLDEADALVGGLRPDPSAGDPGHYAMLEQLRARGTTPCPDGVDPADHDWAFEAEQDRWWHAQLVKLIAEIEAFADEGSGLIEGLSPAHGWGVARRLECAEQLAPRTVSSEAAAAKWDAAIAAVADPASPYLDLELAPIVGLVPLGADPETMFQEFAHVQTGTVPERDEDGKLIITPETGLVFVLVPAGVFDIGAQSSDPDGPGYDRGALPDEGPVHEVELPAFLISKYEMTQGQWFRTTGANPSRYPVGREFVGKTVDLRHPVEMISWHDASRVLGQLGLQLPTEAQWEYAARAGTTTPWSSGETFDTLEGAVNLADRATLRAGAHWSAVHEWPELDDGYATHSPVGTFRPNLFGLHDVHGNVWEWCRDGYWDSYAPGQERPESSTRVNRGGGFAHGATSSRLANRDMLPPQSATGSLGVRPVLEL